MCHGSPHYISPSNLAAPVTSSTDFLANQQNRVPTLFKIDFETVYPPPVLSWR
jgi:hypothetical protein